MGVRFVHDYSYCCQPGGWCDEHLNRFWSRVDKSEDCWVWTKATSSNGYGQLRVGPRPGRLLLAHRISFSLLRGPISDGLEVRHDCDNPPCVNPNHLRVGTHSQNMLDAVERGRHWTPLTKSNSDKTACINGHPFDEANTYIYDGGRECRACRREATRRYCKKRQVA